MAVETKLIRLVEYPLIVSMVLLLVYLCYSDTLGYGFLYWDTRVYIKLNECVHGLSSSNLWCIFSKTYYANWHPLTSFFYAVEYEFFGENPKIYHFNNLLLHSINCLLIYFLAKKIFVYRSISSRQAIVGAMLAAALFAIHPQHTESVAWIAERKGLLSTLFFLLSILCYLSYATGESVGIKRKWFVLTFITFLMSIMSKAMVVTMPVLLLLIDIFPLERISFSRGLFSETKMMKSLIIEKAGFFIIIFIMILVTVYAQHQGGALNIEGGAEGLFIRSINAIYSFFFYITKWVFPLELSPYYAHPEFLINENKALISLCIIAFIVVVAFSLHHFMLGNKALIVVVFFIIISLSPVSGIIQVGGQAAADRYTYLPLIPLYLLFGYYISNGLFSNQIRKRIMGIICVCLVIIAFSDITKTQVKIWKSDLHLWNYVNIGWTGNNIVPPVALAEAYFREGNYEKSLEHFLISDAVGSSLPYQKNYFHFAISFRRMGIDDLALQIYEYLLSKPDLEENLVGPIKLEITAIKNKQDAALLLEKTTKDTSH